LGGLGLAQARGTIGRSSSIRESQFAVAAGVERSLRLHVRVVGDLNCDGVVSTLDIDPFVAALVGRASYETAYSRCHWLNGDINGNGLVDFDDINPFVAWMVAGGCP
jgi:hypothetical protein